MSTIHGVNLVDLKKLPSQEIIESKVIPMLLFRDMKINLLTFIYNQAWQYEQHVHLFRVGIWVESLSYPCPSNLQYTHIHTYIHTYIVNKQR